MKFEVISEIFPWKVFTWPRNEKLNNRYIRDCHLYKLKSFSVSQGYKNIKLFISYITVALFCSLKLPLKADITLMYLLDNSEIVYVSREIGSRSLPKKSINSEVRSSIQIVLIVSFDDIFD